MTFPWPEFGCEFNVPDHTILLTLAGSRSYGTDHPLSDWDYTGILIPPPAWQLGPFKNFKTTGWKDGEPTGRTSPQAGLAEAGREGTIRGLDQFFREAAKCNPNVIEALWVDPDHVVHCTEEGTVLRGIREQFLCRNAARSFGGYAMSQLKRMETHYGYGHTGRPEIPTREQFGLPEQPRMRLDQQGAADKFARRYMLQIAPWLDGRKNDEKEAFWEAVMNICALILEDEGRAYDPLTDNWHVVEQDAAWTAAEKLGLGTNFIQYLKQEKAYGQLLKKQKDYNAWVRNRNPARHELESKYGYDCKHAMHLVRLLRMGKELLATGQLQVYRPDREELQRIRNGEWEYEQVITHAKAELESMYDLARSTDCVLPAQPNFNKLGEMHNQLITRFYARKGYA